MRNYDFYIDACRDAACYFPALRVGQRVRIVAGLDAGRHGKIVGYNNDLLETPWEVRLEGMPGYLPGLMFEADELEVEQG